MPSGWKRVRVLTREDHLDLEQRYLDAITLLMLQEQTPVEQRDETLSLRQIARNNGIAFQTLSRRLALWKKRPWSSAEEGVVMFAPGPETCLTDIEEDELERQCIHMANRGFGLTLETVKRTVMKIVDDGRSHSFGPDGPGEKWWKLFKRRHPKLTLKLAQLLPYYRHNNLTREKMDLMYDMWEKLCIETYGSVAATPPECVWNWDEKPLAHGGDAPKVIAGKGNAGGKGGTRSLSHGNRESSTLLPVVNQAGDALPPHFLLKGKKLWTDLANYCVDGATVGVAPKATMTCKQKHVWCEKHFYANLPEKPTAARPAIAQVDGHCSNVDLMLLDWCAQHHIHLFGLVPHASTRTQTLDVSCNKPCNTHWNSAIGQETKKRGQHWVPTARDVPRLFRDYNIYERAYSKENIIAGWRRTGFYPWNRAAITDDELGRPVVADAEGVAGVCVDDAVASAKKACAGVIPDDVKELRRAYAAMAEQLLKLGEVAQRQRVEIKVKEAAGAVANADTTMTEHNEDDDDSGSEEEDDGAGGKKGKRYFSTFGILTREEAREEKRAKKQADADKLAAKKARKDERETARQQRELSPKEGG